MGKFLTQEEYLERVRRRYGDKYDYSKVEYRGMRVKICVTCKEHGDFYIFPDNFLRRYECKLCKSNFNKRSIYRLNKKLQYFIQPEDYKLIPLTQGKVAMVDNEDFEALKDINWRVTKGSAKSPKGGLMHRMIMNCPDDMVVDHINRNPLDNRKSNLRVCSQGENCFNKGKRKNSTSKYKGVYYLKCREKWVADITKRGKKERIGSFAEEKEAGMAYDKKALELFGEFAYLNFPELKEQYLKEIKTNEEI